MTKAKKKQQKTNVSTDQETDFFLVGIGSSAGGLEAIRELVRNLTIGIPASYVIVQHMSPDHKSLLTTLIGRETSLTVVDVETGIEPRPNTIYVTPPNADVVVRGRQLILRDPSPEAASPKPAVDRFFISAAESFGEKAVGIVLSGTGSDGAYGIQSIRAAGGVTIAQDDKTAKYDGMPISAVETGCIDLVLSPVQIGMHLAKILKSPKELDEFRSAEATKHPLLDLLQIVLARTRVDFRDYKPNTIQRRLERRMHALGIAGVHEYTSYCRTNPNEVDALFKDLLISVTRFFRDPKEFLAIGPMIRKLVLENENRPLRIWIAGCATGEEAYSVAILFAEALGGINNVSKDRLQIFATDIDRNALNVARRGRYSRAALDDIPDEFVSKYFDVNADHIAVHPSLKDVILFSDHNLCQDPPFLHIDLICCRNLLIYFGVSLQARVLARMHYSLLRDGFLFLGTAESVNISDDLFRSHTREKHVYSKRFGSESKERGAFVGGGPLSVKPRPTSTSRASADTSYEDPIPRAMFDALATSLGPNALLLSDDHRILKVYGDLSRFIQLTEASPLKFSVSMLKTSLTREIRALASAALRKMERRKGMAHTIEGDDGFVTQLEAYPLQAPILEEGLCLVVFNRTQSDVSKIINQSTNFGDETISKHVDALESELSSTRDVLQQTIEELETSNEELQSTNEEMQSTNEELQATNEELETSNEELQSTNEELVTVNEELQVSAAELTVTNAEQDAVFGGLESPILILDMALQVTKTNDAAVKLLQVPASFDHPHLSQCRLPNGFPPLTSLCNETLKRGISSSLEFESEGSIYALQCAPFYSPDGKMRGITLIFVESETAKQLAQDLDAAFSSDRLVYSHRNREGAFLNTSDSNRLLSGELAKGGLRGKTLYDLFPKDVAAQMIEEDNAFLDGDESKHMYSYSYQTKDGETWARHSYRHRSDNVAGEEESVFVVSIDISKEFKAEQDLTRVQMALEHFIATQPMLFMHRTHDGQILDVSAAEAELYGSSIEDMRGESVEDFVGAELAQRFVEEDQRFLDGAQNFAIAQGSFLRDGKTHYLETQRMRKRHEHRDDTVYAFSTDITAVKEARDLNARITLQQELATEVSGLNFWTVDFVSQKLFWSKGVYELYGLPPDEDEPDLESALGFYHEDDQERISKLVEAALSEQRSFDFQARLRRADGEVIRVQAQCKMVEEAGEVVSMVGVFGRVDGDSASVEV